jgi:hypothetical protein
MACIETNILDVCVGNCNWLVHGLLVEAGQMISQERLQCKPLHVFVPDSDTEKIPGKYAGNPSRTPYAVKA